MSAYTHSPGVIVAVSAKGLDPQMIDRGIESPADSEQGSGSTCTVKGNLAGCTAAPSDPSLPAVLPSYGLHALLVDDYRVNQMVGARLLARLGITVDIADNGAIAIEKLEAGTHDLVFMDLHMPVMNGWDATAAIRSRNDKLATIPIVALTADADLVSRTGTIEAGMDAHLPKPLRLADIVEVLGSLRIGESVPK